MIKSASDSSEVYLSRPALYYTHASNTSFFKTTYNTKFISKVYTINGELIQTKNKLPSVYILKDNALTDPMVRLDKF